MKSFSDIFLEVKEEYFWSIFQDVSLWQNKKEWERLQRVMKEDCLDKGDVTSDYFETLRLRYALVRDLNGVYEELLILNKFDPENLVKHLRRSYQEVKDAKMEFLAEKELFDTRKYPATAQSLFLLSLEKKRYTNLIKAHKLYEIHSFLAHHYGQIPQVKLALAFNPAMPVKKT